MVLFINGCVREHSRTLELARAVLAEMPGEAEEVRLYSEGPEGLTEETLQLRDALVKKGAYDHPVLRRAVQFAGADTVVLAAPYWDLLFPTRVRAYLEAVTVSGVTFSYGEDGKIQGKCRAKRLIYVTTAGGPLIWNLGFEYVQKLAGAFFGIPDVRLVKAEGLDILGADVSAIMEAAKEEGKAICRDVRA